MLKPFIAKTFANAIWRLEIDELSSIMAIELRNQPEKEVSFAAINLQTGELYFEDYKTPERWLTGIEAVYDGVLLLHHYKHESGPEHKAIVAINITTQKELWSNYSLAFDYLSHNGPVVVYNTNMQPKKTIADRYTYRRYKKAL